MSFVSLNPFTILLLGVVVVTMTSLVFFPPSKYSFMLRRMGLIALVLDSCILKYKVKEYNLEGVFANKTSN